MIAMLTLATLAASLPLLLTNATAFRLSGVLLLAVALAHGVLAFMAFRTFPQRSPGV